MKQPPKFISFQEQMKKGRLSLPGFLGKDIRPLIDILQADDEIVNQLGLTHKMIASKMKELTLVAFKTPGDWVIIDHEFKIKVEEYKGKIPCPFNHPGLYSKNHVIVCHNRFERNIFWSELTIHLIEAHGFYQGIDSLYRINPKDISTILKLK